MLAMQAFLIGVFLGKSLLWNTTVSQFWSIDVQSFCGAGSLDVHRDTRKCMHKES